jgi:ATP-dependent helicase/nuclease subunit B
VATAAVMIEPVALDTVVLLVPSMAAAVELPRRLASAGRALAGLYPFKPVDLARAIAEPTLLASDLRAWDSGHDALIAGRLLDGPHGLHIPPELPLGPVATTLARTLSSLRGAAVRPDALAALAERPGAMPEDRDRLRAVGSVYRRYHDQVEGHFADPATVLRAAAREVARARWLAGAQVLVVDEIELDPLEREFVAALGKAVSVSFVERRRPPGLVASSFGAWAEQAGLARVPAPATLLAPLDATGNLPDGLARLRAALFESPADGAVRDGSVELLTAPGEASEVASLVRRLLREAKRGVPFEEMGVILPRPDPYAPILADTLERLGIPHRLHPSLPLRYGRSARSLLLLFRCRGLPRSRVMEFLTFARIPFEEMLGTEARAWPAQWDALSRDAGIVSGLERWMVGLRSHAEQEREAAAAELDEGRRERRLNRAADADTLLRVVELLSATLDALAGEASWPDWSQRLGQVLAQWIGPDRDRDAVAAVLAELAGLGSVARTARWEEVESVLESRFEWERLPLHPVEGGAVHLGALDAMAGLEFRVVAIPGLAEGSYPGVLRPDPFLLDAEREALGAGDDPEPAAATRPARRQLSLFDEVNPAPPASPPAARLPTTQDRLVEARRLFHRAVSQARERLILSYPRADPRTGRERMPSLFFAAAASAREGRPLGGAELERLVVEDDLDSLPLEDALDPGERDRIRVRRSGDEAAREIAGASPFFKQSRLSSRARWSPHMTAYDGLVAPLPVELAAKLDPVAAEHPISASRLGTFSTCGFQYLLRHVLRLEPALEPEERKRLAPLERGSLFHEVAERFLRGCRNQGELPLRDTPAMRTRLLALADEALAALVKGTPPRFVFLWQREQQRFRATLLKWLASEAGRGERDTPAYFEVGFGLPGPSPEGEPDSPDPLRIDLGDGRTLRVSGKIDRIDSRADGSLVLRDYKTGRAPKDEGGIFRGGRQLQIPFYILAAEALFPGRHVVEAFLDYVDGGRRVALDPESVRGERFQRKLRDVVDAVARGAFVQESAACDFCDYTAVCGPKPLLELRRRFKIRDPHLQRVLQLRDLA